MVEFVNSNLVYWGDKDGVGTDHFVLTLYTDMEVDATGNPIGPGKIMRSSLNRPAICLRKLRNFRSLKALLMQH